MRFFRKIFKKETPENITVTEEKKTVSNLCAVYLEDKYYDEMIDNDDIDDDPTIIKVVYDKNSGEILSRELPCAIKREYCGESSYKYRSGVGYHTVSYPGDIAAFYNICGISIYGGMKEYKKYTVYNYQNKNKNPYSDFSNIAQARHDLKEYCKNNDIKTYL